MWDAKAGVCEGGNGVGGKDTGVEGLGVDDARDVAIGAEDGDATLAAHTPIALVVRPLVLQHIINNNTNTSHTSW